MVAKLNYFRSLHVTRENKLRNRVKGRNGCYFIDKKCRKHGTAKLIIILNECSMKLHQKL
jgi:hypothetical protein